MKVFVPSFSGFCPGVKIAEKGIFKRKDQDRQEEIYVLGHLIHNKNYIKHLDDNDVNTVSELTDIPDHSPVVIRTHGITQDIQQQMEQDFEVIDLTCYKVKKLQLMIQEYSEKGYFIFITGKKKHPEMQGLVSYAKDCIVMETEADLEEVLSYGEHLQEHPCFKNYNKALIVSQTTGNLDLFENAARSIEQVYGEHCEIKVINTICSINSRREQEALDLQKKVDITFVVGDTMSSNANKLYEILAGQQVSTYFIPDLQGLKTLGLPLSDYHSAQVVSSSSTPEFVEKEIVQYLESV